MRNRQLTRESTSPSPGLPAMQEQRAFWDSHWQQWQTRKVLNDWTERRASEILKLIVSLSLQRPRILDFGCGQGWFTERLAGLGEAHGIDLSEQGIAQARTRRPDITYQAGDIYEAPIPNEYFDVVVSQEVVAHVHDQAKYFERAAQVLRRGGHLIVTTGNRWVMERLGDVGWNRYPAEHIERELDRGQLRRLLAPRFQVLTESTIVPQGNQGLLRLVNSHKLNTLAGKVVSHHRLMNWKERAGFGWQMIVLARKKS